MAGWVGKTASGYVQYAVSMCARGNGNGDIFIAGSSAKEMRKWDKLTNTWTTCAALPANVERRGINIIGITGDLIFLTGGAFNPTYPIGTYTYSPTSNTYTARANAPANTYYSAIATDGTSVFLLSGFSGSGNHLGMWKFNIAGNSWTMPGSPSLFPGNATTYWMGGNGGYYYNNKFFIWNGYFDLVANTWTAFASMPTPPDTTALGGIPYATKYALLVTEDVSGISSDKNRIVYFRDLSTAPYSMQSTKLWRTADPLAATFTDRCKFHNGRYFYLHGGSRDTSPFSDTDAFHEYDIELEWPVSTATPNNGATVSTDLPTVTAQVPSNGEEVYVNFQFAKDSAFTNTVKDFFYSADPLDPLDPDRVFSGNISMKTPPTMELSSGTWYYRVRLVNGMATTSWSTGTRQFTVAHAPSASLTFPINGKGITYGTGDVTFQWTFSDTSETDTQTAYQLVLERNDTGGVVLDTGKVSSTLKQHTFNIPATHKDFTLRWRMRLWDSDDVAGSYSSYNTFSVSDAPVVTITAPVNAGTVNTGTPTITWTLTASNRIQRAYQVKFYNSLGILVHDSGKVISTSTSYTPPSQILGVGDASVNVELEDSTFLVGSDTNTFTAIFDEPPQPAFNVEEDQYESLGFIRVSWNSSNRDSSFVEYRVYRREVGVETWDLIHTNTDNSATNFIFDDYTANSNKVYEYAVIQSAFRNETIIESQKTNVLTVSTTSTQYWLVDNDNPERNTLIPNVTSDSFTDEYEETTLKVIGRGNHKDYGTRWGYVGSLSAQLRGNDARSYRLQLEYLKSLRVEMFLRNPFGDIWKVATGNIQVDRISGVGITEMSDITIPYEEVS